MNKSTAVFLINSNVRAILAHYESDTPTSKAPREFFKTFDHSIKEGDLVAVVSSTRHGVTVVKVAQVDVEMDIETTANVQWVIGKIDMAEHYKTVVMENDALAAIASAEKNRKREELKKALFADAESKLQSMPLARFDGPAALNAPRREDADQQQN